MLLLLPLQRSSFFMVPREENPSPRRVFGIPNDDSHRTKVDPRLGGSRNKRESILRNESGPATERRRKAGKKDRGRSDEGRYPILAGVAAGCRVQEGSEGPLIGSLGTESTGREKQWKEGREGETKLANMGCMKAGVVEGVEREYVLPPKRGETLIQRGPLIKCAFIRASCARILAGTEFATWLSGLTETPG